MLVERLADFHIRFASSQLGWQLQIPLIEKSFNILDHKVVSDQFVPTVPWGHQGQCYNDVSFDKGYLVSIGWVSVEADFLPDDSFQCNYIVVLLVEHLVQPWQMPVFLSWQKFQLGGIYLHHLQPDLNAQQLYRYFSPDYILIVDLVASSLKLWQQIQQSLVSW